MTTSALPYRGAVDTAADNVTGKIKGRVAIDVEAENRLLLGSMPPAYWNSREQRRWFWLPPSRELNTP